MIMPPTVIYEITTVVQTELAEKYENFMQQQHIPDLLATGYFRTATFTRSSVGRYRIWYESFDRESLNQYLKCEAERLRADFLAHFPEGVEISRETWEVL